MRSHATDLVSMRNLLLLLLHLDICNENATLVELTSYKNTSVFFSRSIITSNKEIMIHGRLFVCLFVSRITKNHSIFTKFDLKVVNGPRKKPCDFGGNQNHVMLGLCYG